jgi:D-arabinono-1,4-lactone oxidase
MGSENNEAEMASSGATITDVVKYYVAKGPEATVEHFGSEQIVSICKECVKSARPSEAPRRYDPGSLEMCNNVEDVRAVIERARQERKVVRIAGAQHSAPRAVFAEGDQPAIRVKLEGDLRKITVIEENKDEGYLLVRVGAGCNLGVNPSDPMSNEENSFNRTVDKMGYALPILGGMSHHTIGGFMMTSTAGGSLKYSFGDVLESIELVDGQGQARVLEKGTDDFYAAGVSMGLFGVITHVTVKLPRSYLVRGTEQMVLTEKSMLADAATLESTLKEVPYAHCVWFPGKGVDRVLQFKGEQAPMTDRIEEYEHPLKKEWMNYIAAAALYTVNKLEHTDSWVLKELANLIVRIVNPIDDDPKTFCERWYIVLPNDDQALIDEVIRVQFTEIWLDISKTSEVMDALRELFERDPQADGNFGVEVYGAKASPFWMSQSYGRDVLRIDPYWWEDNPKGTLEEFFAKYWEVLLVIPTARLHWGKHMPKVGTRYGDVTIGPDYVAKAFPKFGDWMKLREKYDPEQVFVTTYWRELLGIPAL